MPIFPEGYFDTGKRLPFTFYADMYLEYNLRIAKRYTINLNATIFNFTNTSTIQGYYQRPNYKAIVWTQDQILSKSLNWKDYVPLNEPDPRYGMWTSRYGAWSWRMGARFSF